MLFTESLTGASFHLGEVHLWGWGAQGLKIRERGCAVRECGRLRDGPENGSSTPGAMNAQVMGQDWLRQESSKKSHKNLSEPLRAALLLGEGVQWQGIHRL